MVGVFVAFIRVVYGRMIYMSLPLHRLTLLCGGAAAGNPSAKCQLQALFPR